MFTGSVTYTEGNSFTLKLSDTTEGWSHTVTNGRAGGLMHAVTNDRRVFRSGCAETRADHESPRGSRGGQRPKRGGSGGTGVGGSVGRAKLAVPL